MKIYVFTLSSYNGTKVLFTAEELGLSYELIKLDPRTGEHREPAHVARHPLGKIPVLEHGDRTLFESMVIVDYLQTLSDISLQGDDRHETAQWADYMDHGPGRAVQVFFREEIILQKMNGIEANQEAVAKATKQLDRELMPLDKRLSQHPWLGGSAYSVADVVVLSYTLALADTSYSIERFPNLCDWYARATARPSFARATAHYS